ncbi:hypothetical protein GOBAR_DD15179 [Gossypium barbadense]|nr:hypothetical protein GOBAR_DD15179 [Gossypium barbadense]
MEKRVLHYGDEQGFSVLTSDIPWKTESLWSTMALYMFNLHIPLGFGGLSIVSYLLHQPVLDPQTEALSLLVIDILELLATLFLLKSTIKPNNRLLDIFKVNPVERNWLLASAMGFGVLILLVFLTSIVVDGLYGIKDVNNLILKEMLVRSDISKGACITVYCIITPILEEMVYRGFMLASLASTMNWKQAVVISAAIFSAAHLSDNKFDFFSGFLGHSISRKKQLGTDVRRLEAEGLPSKQAEAITAAMTEVLNDSLENAHIPPPPSYFVQLENPDGLFLKKRTRMCRWICCSCPVEENYQSRENEHLKCNSDVT